MFKICRIKFFVLLSRTIVIALFFLIPKVTFSQQITQDELDPYLKIRKLSTSRERLGNSHLRAYFYRIKNYGDEDISIEFEVILNSPFIISIGQKAIFLFDDGSTASLKCVRSDAARFSRAGYVTNYTAMPLYTIPFDDLSKFLNRIVKGVRVYYDDTYVSMDKIKVSHAEVFKKAVRLIYKEVNPE